MPEPLSYYNRFTQIGADPNTNEPIGGTTQSGRQKGWRFVRFNKGRAIQPPELNEMQSILKDSIKDIGDYVLTNGQTTGLRVRTDLTNPTKMVYLERIDPNIPALVYVEGERLEVAPTSMVITGSGEETVSVTVTTVVVTEQEDPDLYNPVHGALKHFNGRGAYREVRVVTPVIKTPANAGSLVNSYDLFFLQDGQVRSSANDQLNEVDRNLVLYTNDISGNCLIYGLRVQVEDQDSNRLRYVVDRGRAMVQGYRVGYDTTTVKLANKAKEDARTVVGELLTTKSRVVSGEPTFETQYTPANTPIYRVNSLTALTVMRKRAGKNSAPFSQNPGNPLEIFISTDAPFGPLVDVVQVYDVTAAANVPFTKTARGFLLTAVPANEIRVVWVYNASTVEDEDFRVFPNPGNLAEDRTKLEFLRTYPIALDNAGAINGGLGDVAKFVYPGIASRTVASTAASGQDLVNLSSSYGLEVGQKLYIGASLDIGTDELVTVAEVVSSTQIRVATNLTASHASGQFAYVDPIFVGLTVGPSNTQLGLDYAWLLDRIDVVYIDKDANIVIQFGQSNRPAYAPTVPSGVLPLAQIRLPANGDASNAVVTPYRVQRLSQQDLQALLQRVERQDYLATTQNLQLQAYNSSGGAGLLVRGLLVDAFVNSNTVDLNQVPEAFTNVAMDPEEGVLSTVLDHEEILLAVDPAGTTARIGAKSATLGYTDAVIGTVRNEVLTDTELLRGTTNVPKPSISISTGHFLGAADRPVNFSFFNEGARSSETVPSEMEGGYWKERNRELPWLTSRPLFLPSMTILMNGRGFNPALAYTLSIDGTELGVMSPYVTIRFSGAPKLNDTVVLGLESTPFTFTYTSGVETLAALVNALASYMNVNATAYAFVATASGPDMILTVKKKTGPLFPANVAITVTPAPSSTLAAGAAVAVSVVGPDGTFTGFPVAIPANSIAGVNARTVRVSEGVGIGTVLVAETLFGASVSEVKELPTVHDSLATSRHHQAVQTFQLTEDRMLSKVEAYFTTKGTAWVEMSVVTCDEAGTPSTRVLATKRLAAAQVFTNTFTSFVLDDPILVPSGTAVAIAFNASGSGYALGKAIVGRTITVGGTGSVANKPIPTGAVYSSADGITSTQQADASLMIRLSAAQFSSLNNLVKFQPVTPSGLTNIPQMLLRAQQLVPRGANITWSYSINANVARNVIPLDENARMEPQALAQVASSVTLYAEIAGGGNVSGQINLASPRVLLFQARDEGAYTTRNVLNVPVYTKARVSLEAFTLAGPSGIVVKFSTKDDPYGYAKFTLSGVPAYGDVISMNILGTPLTFTFTNDGQGATLERVALRLQAALVSARPDLVTTYLTSGATRVFSIRRVNNRALLVADVTVNVTQSGGSSLATSVVSANYVELPRDVVSTPVDQQFTEYTYSLTGLDSTPGVGEVRTFRVKVELDVSDPLSHTRLRRLAGVVSE